MTSHRLLAAVRARFAILHWGDALTDAELDDAVASLPMRERRSARAWARLEHTTTNERTGT